MSDGTHSIPWWAHVVVVLMAFAARAGMMYREQRPKVEPHAAAIVQADGSRILERNPDTSRPELPQIPKGAKVIRVTTATIAPIAPKSGLIAPSETVQFTQIQAKDGSTRVIASSKDGTITGGSDWTGPAGPPAKIYHWEAQAIRSYSFRGPAWGASIAYTRGPLVGSVAVIPGAGGSVLLGLGVRW